MPVMNVCGEECEVVQVSEFARGKDGRCAFCHGDPCAEQAEPGTAIYRYMREPDGKYRRGAVTCPCCNGRPT